MNQTATIGIIGGADGPTAIFVTTGDWTAWIAPALVLLAGITIWLLWRRRKS